MDFDGGSLKIKRQLDIISMVVENLEANFKIKQDKRRRIDIRENGAILLITLGVLNKIDLIIWFLAAIYVAHLIRYRLILFENKVGLFLDKRYLSFTTCVSNYLNKRTLSVTNTQYNLDLLINTYFTFT